MRAGLLRYSIGASFLFAGLPACSSPSAPQVPAVGAPVGDAEGAEAESLSLTPAAAPDNIVGVATLRAPARTLDVAMAWTGLGLSWRSLLEAGPAAPFLPVLNLDAPVDLVVTLDPKVKNRPRTFVAASIGLTSRQAALEVFESLKMPVELVEPGVHGVRPNDDTFCFLSAALGIAKARLVCGEDRESVELLHPYLTRGNPSDRAGNADLHVELLAEAPWRLFGDKTQFLRLGVPMMLGEVSIGNADFDAALRDAATGIVDELIASLGDLEDLKLDAWLHSGESAATTNELELKLASDFKSAKSWAARALATSEKRATLAPDSFWKLPADATEAIYYAAGDPAAIDAALAVVERLFRSGLGHLGASPGVQQQWPTASRAVIALPGPMVLGRGEAPAGGATPDERESLRASLGYTILGVEDPDNQLAAWLEQTLRLYDDATLRKSLTQKYGLEVGKLPKAQSRKGPARLPDSRVYEVALPAALYVEALDKPGVDPAKLGGPIPLFFMLFREGQRTWLGFSSYAPLLEARLTSLLTPGGTEATLESKAGLDRLRREPANIGGFWTLAGLQSRASLGRDELSRLLSSLGRSEVPIVGRAYGRSAGPSGELQVHVPAQLFRDVAMAMTSQTPASQAPASQAPASQAPVQQAPASPSPAAQPPAAQPPAATPPAAQP